MFQVTYRLNSTWDGVPLTINITANSKPRIKFLLFNGNSKYNIPPKSSVYIGGLMCAYDGNSVYFETASSFLNSVSGLIPLTLQVTNNDKIAYTSVFYINVESNNEKEDDITMVQNIYKLNTTWGSVPLTINVSQYDDSSRVFGFELYHGSSRFTVPDGASVFLTGKKSDGTGFLYPCTYDDGIVYCTLRYQMTVISGRIPLELQIVSSSEILYTSNFYLNVQKKNIPDESNISEDDLPVVQEIIQASQQFMEKTGEAVAAAETATEAAETATEAADRAMNSEAWAVGTRDGVPVDSSDETFQNNSKYYASLGRALSQDYLHITDAHGNEKYFTYGEHLHNVSNAGTIYPPDTSHNNYPELSAEKIGGDIYDAIPGAGVNSIFKAFSPVVYTATIKSTDVIADGVIPKYGFRQDSNYFCIRRPGHYDGLCLCILSLYDPVPLVDDLQDTWVFFDEMINSSNTSVIIDTQTKDGQLVNKPTDQRRAIDPLLYVSRAYNRDNGVRIGSVKYIPSGYARHPYYQVYVAGSSLSNNAFIKATFISLNGSLVGDYPENDT